jgi:hypothetical protein
MHCMRGRGVVSTKEPVIECVFCERLGGILARNAFPARYVEAKEWFQLSEIMGASSHPGSFTSFQGKGLLYF